MGEITNTSTGYEKAKSWFRSSYYISPYIKNKINAFKVPKTLSLSDQLALITYEYSTLGLKYDTDGSSDFQFQALDYGYGKCHSMMIVFKNFLEKTQVPHRKVYQDFVLYNPKKIMLMRFLLLK